MKLDWRKGILYIAIFGMEGCWLYALITLLNKQVAGRDLSTFGLLLLYPLAFGFNKLLQQTRWSEVYLRSLSWLAWVMGMLLMVKIQLFSSVALSDPVWLLALPQAISQIFHGFRPELLILVSSAVLWWLGQRLAYIRIDFAASISEFQFGLALLLIAFFIAYLIGADLANSVSTALAFFLFALFGVSIAHAQEGTSWLSGLYQGHWLGLLLVSISLVVILGLLISIITPDLLQLIVIALKWVWVLIMKVLASIASLLPRPEPVELPPAMLTPDIEPSEGFKMWTMPESLRSGIRIGWTIMMLGLILTALWRVSSEIFGWLRRKLTGMEGAEFEPLPGAFRADFFSFLKRMLIKLVGLRLLFRSGGKSSSILPETASVRHIYRQLLHWAAAGGCPRRKSQTPHEYLYTLVDWLPAAREGMVFITQQYVTVRYGISLPTEGELRQLRQVWQGVRQNRLKRRSGLACEQEVSLNG